MRGERMGKGCMSEMHLLLRSADAKQDLCTCKTMSKTIGGGG